MFVYMIYTILWKLHFLTTGEKNYSIDDVYSLITTNTNKLDGDGEV